jgi:hypothetical protein
MSKTDRTIEYHESNIVTDRPMSDSMGTATGIKAKIPVCAVAGLQHDQSLMIGRERENEGCHLDVGKGEINVCKEKKI